MYAVHLTTHYVFIRIRGLGIPWKIKIELTPQEGEDIGAEGLDDVVPGNTKRPYLKKTYRDLRFLYFSRLDNSISTLVI